MAVIDVVGRGRNTRRELPGTARVRATVETGEPKPDGHDEGAA
jgi:hypothetical protein